MAHGCHPPSTVRVDEDPPLRRQLQILYRLFITTRDTEIDNGERKAHLREDGNLFSLVKIFHAQLLNATFCNSDG